MRRIIIVLALTALMVAALPAAVGLAHNLGPCNNGEVAVTDVAAGATGHNYGIHHVKAAATAGALGAGGHIPGTHHGFSLCNPSGQ